VITLRSGTHQIGEHAIKGGQFHNNEPCYFEEEVLINKKLVVQVKCEYLLIGTCAAGCKSASLEPGQGRAPLTREYGRATSPGRKSPC